MPKVSLSPGAAPATALARLAAEFPPASFAFVMATGIVSISAARVGLRPVADALLAANAVAFPAMWLLLLLRLWQDPLALVGDLRHHQRGPGLLTIVAGTCVVGSQVSLLTGDREVAAALWVGGGIIWVLFSYSLFAAMTTRASKPAFDGGVDGGWLLVVVASEALAILGTHAVGAAWASRTVLFASFCLFLLGGLFYLILLTLIVYRWLFLPMAPEQLAPSYWINMGAAAIATLAGARLLPAIAADPALAPAGRFVFTETILFWSVATWWIPLLAAVSLWRYRAIGLQYRLDNWSIVFPLGMYAAASWSFAQLVGLPSLLLLPRVFVWIALAAWGLTFVGMLRRLARAARLPRSTPQQP